VGGGGGGEGSGSRLAKYPDWSGSKAKHPLIGPLLLFM